MDGKRKPSEKSAASKTVGRGIALPGRYPSTASAKADDAKGANDAHHRDSPWWVGRFAADPPRRHLWFLAVSGLALAGWLAFLVAMAVRG